MTESDKWAFQPGMDLSAALFEHAVRPLVDRYYPRLDYGFGRLGHGSAVLGFDTAESMDHGWGPRGTLFMSRKDAAQLAPELDQLFAREFPRAVLGVPTHLDDSDLNVARPSASASSSRGTWASIRLPTSRCWTGSRFRANGCVQSPVGTSSGIWAAPWSRGGRPCAGTRTTSGSTSWRRSGGASAKRNRSWVEPVQSATILGRVS